MSETRCGFAAIIGAPNAGKSTLINALVGEKVSIVTRKAQTTRSTVRGVLTRGEAQIVFVDTPGLFAPKRRLDRAMVASAWGAAADADVLMLLIDARKEADASLTEDTQSILAALGDARKPRLAVLNKVDLVERPKLLELAAKLNAALAFDETFMVSATTGDGLDRLLDRLAALIPVGPWLYPEDQIAEAPDPVARRRDHPREADRAAARRIALSGDRRDRQLEGLAGRHRPASSRRSSSPARATARSSSARVGARSRRSARRRARTSVKHTEHPCISSCTSKCASAGSTTPSATGRWGSTSPRGSAPVIAASAYGVDARK